MSATNIEWTDRTWRTAAARTGLALADYRANVDAGLKFCWRCRLWRAVGQFGRDSSRWDGLASKCNACRRQPVQVLLPLTSPADRDRLRYATDEAYRHERRQHASARRRGVAKLPIEAAEGLIEWAGGQCLYCEATATTWDHIVPVSAGGDTVPGNIAPACASCNARKKALDVYEFIGRYRIPITARLDNFLSLAVIAGHLQ